jgi:excisionase family DNA binding protein
VIDTPINALPGREERRLYDIPSAVAYLRAIGAEGVTTSFVRSLINSGGVPHVRMGRKFYVTREALDRWIDLRQRKR